MSDYEKYRLQWMINHNHSLSELISELSENQYQDPEDSDAISRTVKEIFADWENDSGFGGEIWACESEWEECEGLHDQ